VNDSNDIIPAIEAPTGHSLRFVSKHEAAGTRRGAALPLSRVFQPCRADKSSYEKGGPLLQKKNAWSDKAHHPSSGCQG